MMTTSMLPLFAALVASSAAVLLGGNRCTWGPSYWCTSIGHAKECSAMDHCTNVFWKNMKPTAEVKDNDVCQLCENIITDVRQFLLSGKPQQVITAYVETGCSVLPDTFARNTCDDVVQHYIAEFFQLVNSTLDPQVACEAMLICLPAASAGRPDPSKPPAGAVEASSTTQQVLRKVMLQKAAEPVALKSLLKPAASVELPQSVTLIKSNPADCIACKLFAEKIIGSLESNATEQEILAYIENTLCSRLGNLAQECDSLVQQYLPQLLQLIISKASPDTVCDALGMCSGLLSFGGKVMPRNTLLAEMKLSGSRFHAVAARLGDEKCDTCEEVVNYVKLALSDNSTEEYVLSFLKGEICPLLKGFSAECSALIDEFGPELFNMVLHLDTAKICSTLGFCSNPASSPTLRIGAAKAPVESGNSVECVLCEFVIEKLDGMLGNNRSEAAIARALGQVCSLLPPTIRQGCKDVVSRYGPAIAGALQNFISPKVVCSFIGVCSAGRANKKMNLMVKGNSFECDACLEVAQYAQSMLQSNATEGAIISALEQLCSELPSASLASECSALVAQYGPKIIEMLASDIDPKTVCQKLDLCSSVSKTAQALANMA